jgi:hypothetical protein
MGSLTSTTTTTRRLAQWLDGLTTRRQVIVGWVLSTVVFVGLVYFLGGPTVSDSISTSYPTWAIAHGSVACAYPAKAPFPQVDTLYPIIAGGLSFLFGIGHGIAFPTAAQLGPHCSHAVKAISAWSNKGNIIAATDRLAFVGWLFLTGGVLLFLRETPRWGQRWVIAALMLMAISPPVLDGIYVDLHPEDFIALGLGLTAVVLARHKSWFAAGLLIGFAVTSQQFALLIAAPLFILIPHRQKMKYALGAALSFLSVASILAILTSGRSIRSSLIGSGYTPAAPGTIVTQLHIANNVELTFARALPIILATALAWWVWRRLGEASFEPLILTSLIATSLVMRIVFDPNLWGYYALASAVGIILIDVQRGWIRLSFFLWLAIILLVYGPWNNSPLFYGMAYWQKQVLIVPFAVYLAAGPLARLWWSKWHPSPTDGGSVPSVEGQVLDEETGRRVVDAS